MLKNITVYLFLICVTTVTNAQNYQISFTGVGASSTVDSVIVENLSQCTKMNIAGSDILNLITSVGLDEISCGNNNNILIFPNPASGSCSIEFLTATANNACISLYDMSGKSVIQQIEFLPKGYHKFLLKNIKSGAYSLIVKSDHYQYSAKLISNCATQNKPMIKNLEAAVGAEKQMPFPGITKAGDLVGDKSIIDMQFNAGDTLKITGKSGNYRTVSMLFPNQSQTLTFNFFKCTDADSNHYAVVQIGTQLWMQENLKTTKYRDGSGIPNVPDSSDWGSLTSGAYCDYHNLPAEGAYYGHLYNFYAVDDSRNMCPVGWHVPSQSEWNIMEKFLDLTVDTTALGGTGTMIGRILKEGCDTRWQYYDSTYGFNSAGFTALCANYRVSSGAWSLAPDNNHDCGFWTSTSYNTNSAWYRSLRWCTCDIYVLFPFKRSGHSVRCIKD